jgi:two-component system sensor histidine kinase VicK
MTTLYKSQATLHPIHQSDPYYRGVHLGHWKLSLRSGSFNICPNARKMLGQSLTKSVLKEFLGKLSYADTIMLIRSYKNAVATGSNLDVELSVWTHNRYTKWIHIKGTILYRRWGMPDCFIGTIEDTTQRRSEENLNLSIIGHEIRNPLSIIKLNTELVIKLMQPHHNQQQVRLLSMVDEHVNGITSVLDERLSVSVNERRQMQLQITEFDLHCVMDRLISEMRLLHRANKFDCLYRGEMWVSADRNRIVRVLINYMTNAVKFSHPSAAIKISSAVRKGMAEICITDQGIGVPQGWEEKIFEKHVVHPDHKGRQQNSKGLGLYIVKKIIEEHGGKVKAEQAREGGAAFYFSLPLLSKEKKTETSDYEYEVIHS